MGVIMQDNIDEVKQGEALLELIKLSRDSYEKGNTLTSDEFKQRRKERRESRK